MITIQTKKPTEEVKIGDHTYTIDFSDEAVKSYFKAAEGMFDIGSQIVNRMPDMDNEKDYHKVAGSVISALTGTASALKAFFDKVLGDNAGNEIYEACGGSTDAMADVFSQLWDAIVSRSGGSETAAVQKAKRYVKNKNLKAEQK